MTLEVKYDPESADIMLFLMARQEHYSDDVEDLDDEIDKIRRMYRSAGFIDTIDFHVMTDFQPPLQIWTILTGTNFINLLLI